MGIFTSGPDGWGTYGDYVECIKKLVAAGEDACKGGAPTNSLYDAIDKAKKLLAAWDKAIKGEE